MKTAFIAFWVLVFVFALVWRVWIGLKMPAKRAGLEAKQREINKRRREAERRGASE